MKRNHIGSGNKHMDEILCGCVKCTDVRRRTNLPSINDSFRGANILSFPEGWRYSCEICGNKRCPHHENHEYICTNSNASNQIGKKQ